jgi:hypothetical protein
MAGNAGNNQRIIPLDEGWDDEIKAKVRKKKEKNRRIKMIVGSIESIIEYKNLILKSPSRGKLL